ncbi:MAG: glutathione S-transferase N-terminal domain-containing protein [Pseudomonadota bacterium]|nr:glutathione S-transferase N-terminal domain-containing protein [Pseudomonadota bacterium]
MILYSDRDNHYSHRVRIVLAEKDITCEIREFDTEDVSDEILAMSNTHQLPILVDRDLNLSDTGVIMEYLDERFPHPPLLPVYPVSRASCRELMLRIDREWCPLVDQILNSRMTKKKEMQVKEELVQQLATISPTFKEFAFFMNEDFTLVDCYLAPILWRLPSMGINLPYNKHLKPLLDYQAKLFDRPGFNDSLTTIERDLKG